MSADEQYFLERFNPNKVYKGLKSFDCGDKIINDFIPQLKRQTIRDNIHTEVLLDESETFVGFCTATIFQLARDVIPEGSYPFALPPIITVMKIPMIGIDGTKQGNGWGSELMYAVLEYCLTASENVAGIKGVYIDALTERVGFYRKLDFSVIEQVSDGHTTPMLLTMDKLRNAIALRRASA